MSVNRFSVCPHDTAKNTPGWFLFNTYLQRNLNCGIRFEPRDNFIEERELVLNSDNYRIVYANPYSAAVFRKSLGFIPVAKPVGHFDETLLVGKAEVGVPGHHPLKIASATDKLIVHPLGLTLLEPAGISAADCEFLFVGTHLKAAQAVIQGKTDLAFVYSETWHGMSKATTHDLAVISQTSSRQAYHCFCISPAWNDKLEQVQEILSNMKNDSQGKRILDELGFSMGLEPVSPQDLDTLIQLLGGKSALEMT